MGVTPKTVHFSAEFKRQFWEEYLTGKTPREIIIELGIDPDLLGETRVRGIKTMVSNEVKAGKGFRDIETYKATINGFMTPEAKIQLLEQKLAYKEQEVEFLKKIVSLNQEWKGT